ncbi:COG2958 family protein [Legionella pneumophila]|uniref:HrgA protein n=2 Tax=Legionella TaxID=445 RepID=A0A222P383_9GAMM|nr:MULTISPECIES: hypothetical protein [Legionella]AMV13731.1 hypothetical protein ULM_10480 [Legionella pneumophila]ANN92032.1 HrgA protein [Legionella pneumophila]ASQ46291.1 hypothetical protein clem_08695 [Legionella clemsonensis]MCK1850706.1 hypothetical protein [Legionella pneumophila]MDI9853320.1 hypothetical protein [Legionella pneumophila]
MALNLSNTVTTFLADHPEEKFTAREIALWIFENFPNECREKQNRSTATVNPLDNDNALIQQIIAEIGAQRPRIQRNPNIKTTESRPRKYYFSEKTDRDEIENAENEVVALINQDKSPQKEHDLYPVLSEFLWTELNLYSKRIDEKRSKNKRGPNGNRWLYPDLVGLENLSSDWNREVKDCVQHYSDKKTKLWSFEVKLLINQSNVREAFFQAVSNSSWANFGYLVSGEIEGSVTLKELRMLASLHGIGFMRLDAENPSESQIIIPAKERTLVDWDTVNRLVEQNSDFQDYIKNIRQFYQTGEIRPTDWDYTI